MANKPALEVEAIYPPSRGDPLGTVRFRLGVFPGSVTIDVPYSGPDASAGVKEAADYLAGGLEEIVAAAKQLAAEG